MTESESPHAASNHPGSPRHPGLSKAGKKPQLIQETYKFGPFQVKNRSIRHTREGGYPFFSTSYWIPAYAGMTESENHENENLPKMDIGAPALLPANVDEYRGMDADSGHDPHPMKQRSAAARQLHLA